MKIISSFFLGLLTIIFCCIVFFFPFLLFRTIILEPFHFEEEISMLPTFHKGQYFIINKLFKKINRFDILVHRNPENTEEFMVRRVVGLPGETVLIDKDKIFVNGKEVEKNYMVKLTEKPLVYILATNEYFVLGDNPMESTDSREFGPIKGDFIKGKYFFGI